MNENEVTAKIQEWESAGFEFVGNGFESNEDDPTRCPKCDSAYIFWALWEHPTLTMYANGNPQGGEYNRHLLNGVNHCYDCDNRWIDEETQQ